MIRLLAALLALVSALAPARAWSFKEHAQLTRLAVGRVLTDPAAPDELKAWLRDVTPGLRDAEGERRYVMEERVGRTPTNVSGLAWWAIVPDLQVNLMPRGETVGYAPGHERLMHYVDLELFNEDEAKRAFLPDGSAEPPLSALPRDAQDRRYVQAGFLPFAAQHSYDALVKALREKRLKPRDAEDVYHAVRWAGYLAHYVQDNTQPHHSTVDYKSASFFPGGGRKPDVHAEMEYRLLDDEREAFPELRAKYWELLSADIERATDPAASADVWQGTLEVAAWSYDALPLIGTAAAGATRDGKVDTVAFFETRGAVRGEDVSVLEMKTRQQAVAVRRLEALLVRAWKEAH